MCYYSMTVVNDFLTHYLKQFEVHNWLSVKLARYTFQKLCFVLLTENY